MSKHKFYMKKNYVLSTFILLLLISNTSFSQNIIINEIQAKNITDFTDNDTFGFLDWFELKNTSPTPVDIGGYYLTDNPDNLQKWTIPPGTTISANGYLLIFSDPGDLYFYNDDNLHCNFGLSSTGETLILSDPFENEVHRVEYPLMRNDISYGQLGDGSYSLIKTATPNEDNMVSSAFTYIEEVIEIDVLSGLYSSAQTVSISTLGEGQLYYSLDGSTPDQTSIPYTTPITITTNTVLKAILIKSAQEFSIVENRSYIIGATHNLPIVLLTSDNSSFDFRNKEVIEGRVEFNFIETDGTTVINQYADFNKSGRSSVTLPQLMGKVRAHDIYGDGDFDHKMYPNKNIDEFRSFLLRNAGQDWANTHLRDAFVSELIGKDNLTDTPFEAYRPAVLYVNAKYQGIINIREDNNRDYVRHNFELSGDEFEKVINSQSRHVEFSNLDFNIEADRDSLSRLVDFHEHLSLKLLFSYVPPGEWGWTLWEDLSGKTGTRFHYNFHDFDPILGLAFDAANYTDIEDTPMPVNNFFEPNITNYEPYKNEALQFIAASINHIYNTGRSLSILNEMQVELQSEIPDHSIAMTELANDNPYIVLPRYMPSTPTQWNGNMEDLKTNVSNRMGDDIFDRIGNEYGLDGLIEVTYESSDINSGYVRVHEVKSQTANFTGTYFANIPIRFAAEALPGYRFVTWEGDITNTEEQTTATFSTDAYVKAIFEPVPTTSTAIVINEIQGKNDTTVTDEYGEYNDWIEIYNPESTPVNLAGYYISDNLSEPLTWKIPDTDADKTTVQPGGFLLLWADSDPEQGPNHLGFKLKTTDQVILTAPDAVTVVQQVSYTDLPTNKSYGAKVDASPEYIVFDIPTPNATNSSTVLDQDNDTIVDAEDDCPTESGFAIYNGCPCPRLDLTLYLEGPYDETTDNMTTTLNTSHQLLPGQTPISALAAPTPAGQPYSAAPWNYTGTEGLTFTNADYSSDVVDWVLLSLRTDIEKSSQVLQIAALLLKDGTVQTTAGCTIDTPESGPFYIVVEHRNHMGIMSPESIDLTGTRIIYDFSLQDSYRVATGVGQKQLPNDRWAMFTGDADQFDFPSFDIQAADKSIWLDNNGNFGNYYLPSDFNLDGDINGYDKAFWFNNNGLSSRVPK